MYMEKIFVKRGSLLKIMLPQLIKMPYGWYFMFEKNINYSYKKKNKKYILFCSFILDF
jgi:hypothetical protein